VKRIFFGLINLSTIIVIFYNLHNYNEKSSSLDYLQESLMPVKEILNGHNVISMFTHEEDKTIIYFQSQFSLAPNILEQSSFENDTIVIVDRVINPAIQKIEGFDNLIARDSNLFFKFSLYSK